MKPGQWWDRTANWQAGCSKCSPGCAHCWALAMTRRMVKNPKAPRRYTSFQDKPLKEDGEWSGGICWEPAAIDDTFLKIWATRTPLVWFLGGMTDLWHESCTEWSLFELFSAVRRETRQLLVFVTKRPTNLLAWQRLYFPGGLPRHAFVFLTVCNQEEYNAKTPIFWEVDGRKGLHMEPLLGPIEQNLPFDFIAAGAESGPGARPVNLDWLRSIRDQCAVAGVPFFLKRPLTLDGAEHAPRLEMP